MNGGKVAPLRERELKLLKLVFLLLFLVAPLRERELKRADEQNEDL